MANNNFIQQFIPKKLGKKLEADMTSACLNVFPTVISTVGGADDLYDGTDVIVDGLRIDFTANFDGKDFTTELGKAIEIIDRGDTIATVRFGFRTGNARHDFKEPVLVFAIEEFGNYLHREYDRVVAVIESMISELIEIGTDRFWSHCDAVGISF